jgi:hypothetical protein
MTLRDHHSKASWKTYSQDCGKKLHNRTSKVTIAAVLVKPKQTQQE